MQYGELHYKTLINKRFGFIILAITLSIISHLYHHFVSNLYKIIQSSKYSQQ